MPKRQISLQPVMAAVDGVMERLQNAEFTDAQQFEREKAIRLLSAVRQLLEAMCLAPPGEQALWNKFDDGEE